MLLSHMILPGKYKLSFIAFLFFICFRAHGQELNTGISVGLNYISDDEEIVPDEKNSETIAAIVEYRPDKAFFSLTTEARFIFAEDKTVVNFPLSFKFVLGNKIRVCPSLGAFINTNSHYGGLLGLNAELHFDNEIAVFAKYEFYREYYKEDIHTTIGSIEEETTYRRAQWIGIGVKYNLL